MPAESEGVEERGKSNHATVWDLGVVGRRTWPVSVAVLGVVLVMLTSGLAAGLAGSPAHGSASSPCSGGSTNAGSGLGPAGEVELAAAQRSLSDGLGPASSDPGLRVNPDATGRACSSSSLNSPAITTPSWTQETFPSPPPTDYPSMVYDAQDHYVLLFGGQVGTGTSNQTWTYSNGIWTQLHPKTSPSGRALAGLAYDATDHYVVMFGGYNFTTYVLGDTWKFAGGVWTKLAPKTHPGRLYGEGMVYDTKDGYVVLYGGFSSASAHAQSTTWTFVAGDWTKLSLTTFPSARSFPMMDWDAADGYVLLFGGEVKSGSVLSDTWKFVGGAWTKLSPTVHPSARLAGAIAYDGIDREVVLFGGLNATFAPLADTWVFAAGGWTKISPPAHPPEVGPSAADGTSSTPLVIFGGYLSGSLYNETWTFQGGSWSAVIHRAPAPRLDEMLTYDAKDGYVLLFGGESTTTGAYFSDTWAFSNGTWTALHPSVSPSARIAGAMTYDAADGYVVLFGGETHSGSLLGDTWTFSDGVWTQLATLDNLTAHNAPAPRWFASIAYDYSDGYVLLFGGANATQNFGDTWSYSGGAWVLLAVSSPPGARYAAGMSYDSNDGYVLLLGGAEQGKNGRIAPGDTWSFLGGVWTNLTASLTASPPHAIGQTIVDDTYDGYPLMYGGESITGTEFDTTWEYNGTAWEVLNPAHNPGAAANAAMAFDASNNVVVFVSVVGTTWTY